MTLAVKLRAKVTLAVTVGAETPTSFFPSENRAVFSYGENSVAFIFTFEVAKTSALIAVSDIGLRT